VRFIRFWRKSIPASGNEIILKGKRIVFIRLRSLGDTLLMTPALEVASSLGANQVAVVVEEPFDLVLRGNPAVDRIIVPGRRGDFLSRMKCIKEIRSFSPDLVFDMHGGTTSSIMAFLSGSELRVGFAASRNSGKYNMKVPDSRAIWQKDRIHTVEHQLSPLVHMGFRINEIPPLRISVDEALKKQMRIRLADQGIDKDFVLIHPAAAFATKQWSVDSFATVAADLGKTGISCAATAGPGQEKLLEALSAALGNGLAVFPPGSLGEFTALASLCSLYLGNDTGPTHIAAALKKKVVVIFGSSNHEVWHPWGTEYRLLRSDMECVPCPGYKCLHYPEPVCIQSVSVNRVLEAVHEMLDL
jgi:heptosyltransferase-2/heptosyltransferase-3